MGSTRVVLCVCWGKGMTSWGTTCNTPRCSPICARNHYVTTKSNTRTRLTHAVICTGACDTLKLYNSPEVKEKRYKRGGGERGRRGAREDEGDEGC